ncbi:MAG: ABC transporter substrate-binding protein [Treponema sp.]|nr:ABC transporter substrate-binding protein [Treponema sp.]
MNRINRIFYFLLLAMLPLVLSCGSFNKDDQAETREASPLETVRALAAENRQYENARSRSTTAHAPEIKAILDRGYIVFAMTAADQKPFFYKHEQTGEFIGLDVEIAYAIANRLGVKAEFNRNPPTFDGVVTAVINKEADVALSKLSLTIRRAELIRYTQPYITFRQALLINRLEYAKYGTENQLPNFLRNFQGNLGVIVNSSYHNFALINFPSANIKTFTNWDAAVDALFTGEVLAVYRDEGEVLIVNNTRQDASILLKPVFIGDRRDQIAMAVSSDAPLLQDWLNIFLDDYLMQNHKELTPGRIIERHFGGF